MLGPTVVVGAYPATTNILISFVQPSVNTSLESVGSESVT